MRGKVVNPKDTDSQKRDHPRLCGEKVTAGSTWFRLAGSPPPMRGKAHTRGVALRLTGITPAYAGKSNVSAVFRKANQDHPRLCGEKSDDADPLSFREGSPPPMRGKVISNNSPENSFGITPAYAGKRGVCDMILYVWQDHPRLCGEKKCGYDVKFSKEGSPPPMRGKVPFCQMFTKFHGITPAYAGKRSKLHFLFLFV